MAWIDCPDESHWPSEIQELREELADPHTGRVDNILAVHARDAGSLRAHLAVYQQAMRGTTSLPKVDREMIALVVSRLNGCHY